LQAVSQEQFMDQAADERVIDDVACTVCACVCDDLRITVRGGRIVDYQPFCSRIGNWFEQQNERTFPPAFLDGVECPRDQAIDHAARILADARSPLFYGLSRSSTEGQRAALDLAEDLGATIDTTASEGHAPSIIALQQVGESTCSLGEIRNRADLVIYWGSDPIQWQPRHLERYSMRPGMLTPGGRSDRTLVVVDSERTQTAELADIYLPIERGRDFEALWTLRGLIRGIQPEPGRITGLPVTQLQDLADRMRNCRCGIVFFGYGLVLQPMGSQNVQALLQLVTELNQFTRFHARRMRVAGDVSGADSVLCWQTGYPFSVNLARGYPRYSPDEYSAVHMLESSEADAAVLIGAACVERFPDRALEHLKRIPTILLEHPFGQLPFTPTIRITTAIYGIHRHGTAYRMDEIPIPLRPVLASSDPSDDEVLREIQERMKAEG
jgi:formylmethanofuran dehydrogenase subunit B